MSEKYERENAAEDHFTYELEDFVEIGIEHEYSFPQEVTEISEAALAEIATLRAESAELHKLMGMLGNGAMARAGRDMWHELRRYRDDGPKLGGLLIKPMAEIKADAWDAVTANYPCPAEKLYLLIDQYIERIKNLAPPARGEGTDG